MYFQNLLGLIIFSAAFLLMILTVPWEEIKRFAGFGIISGLGIAGFLLLVMQNWLGLWIYHQVDLIYVARIPIILSAAWVPAEIFFAHFLDRNSQPILRLVLILFLPAVAVGAQFFQIWNHMLTYHNWNYLGTYFVSLGIHGGLAFYLNRFFKISVF